MELFYIIFIQYLNPFQHISMAISIFFNTLLF